MSNYFIKLNKYIKRFTRSLLVFLITSVAILVVLQVILRYILHMPLHYCDEILSFASVWLYMLGALNASIEEMHINARILEVISKKIRYISGLRLMTAVISIFVSGWLAYWSFDFFVYSVAKNKQSLILKYPLYYMESAVFICFVPMFIYAIVEAIKYFNIFKNNDANGVQL